MLAHIFLVLCAIIVAHSQVTSIGTLTTNQELQDTILPCTTKFYKWRVTAPSALYYLEVNLTTINSVQLNIVISKQQPSDQLNGGIPLDKPTPAYCAAARSSTPAVANSLITLEEYCEVSDGDWYVSIESVGATAEATFRLLATPKALPTPTEIFVNDNVDVPGTAVTVRPTTGSIFDNNDFYFFDLAKKPLQVPGSRIRVEVIPDSQPNNTVTIFMNYNRIAIPPSRVPGAAACGVFPGMTGTATLTLSACVYKQGGKWYLTVDRNPNIVRSYTMKVYVEAPILQDFNAVTNNVYYSLKKEKDIVYFRYTNLDSKIADSTFVVVADNVVNGRVTLGVLQRSLPFQDCTLADRLCDTDVSCHITNYPCDRSAGVWFFGVRADSLVNTNDPLTFTLHVYIAPTNISTIASSTAIIPGTVQRNQYVTFKMPKPARKGDWLQVHVFVDYTRLLVPADVQLYLGDKPGVGSATDGSCFGSLFGPCTATKTVKDIGSCSIQLDPCQLARFTDTVYIGVKGVHTGAFSYFYTQDIISFTLSVEITNPTVEPYLIKENSALLTYAVEESQYRIFSVVPFVGNFQIQADVTDERNSAGVEVMIVSGQSEVEGPTCKCWNPTSRVNVTSVTGPVVVYQSDICQNSIQNGLYIVVKGNPTPTGVFTYTERQFTLLLVKTVSPNNNLLTPTSLMPKVQGLFQSGKYYFALAFPRENLMSKALAITLRSSTLNATVSAQLFRFPKLPSISCDYDKATSVVSWLLRNVGNESDPDHFTAVQNCLFVGDRDGAEYVVAVDARSGTIATVPSTGPSTVPVTPTSFAISFEIVDRTPRALQSGVAVSSGLRQNIYEHFYLDIAPAQAGKNNLVVEAYFDAGAQEGENTDVMLFVNTPSLSAPAGSSQVYLPGETTSCYCNEYSFSDKRKIVFTVNSCNLKSGRYYFSLLTRQVVYSQAQYTITATLKPGLVGQLNFDFPINFAAYVGQPFSFALQIPPEMLSSTTYTGRVLQIKADNTRPNDQVSLYLSRSVPSDVSAVNTSTCSCYSVPPTFTCTTDNSTSCRINQPYCNLANNGGAGTWYVTAFVKQAEDPKNPVGFTLFASNKNDHEQIVVLPATNGCGTAGKAAKVNNKQYQYFSIDTTGLSLTGQENFEVKIRNLKGGVITVVTGKNNLPTLGCSSVSLPCATPDCDLRLPCGALDATHLGVYATSSANNDPVEFEILLCFSPVKSITLNSPAILNQKLARDGSQSYRIDRLGMVSLNLTRAPIVSAIISKYSLSPATASHDFVLGTGRCGNCVSSFTDIQGVTRRRCGSADSDSCLINVFGCNLPSNYGTVDWYVDINNGATGLTEIQYDFEVKSIYIGDNVVALSTGADTPVGVQPGGWAVASWTISPAEITTSNSILQRAELAVSGTGLSVDTYLGIGSIAFPTCSTFSNLPLYVLQQCCVQPQTYYITLRNRGTTATTVTLSPKLVPTSGIVTTTWSKATSSAMASATVTQNDNTEGLVNVVVPFPGLPSGGSLLYVQATNTDATNTYNKLYIEKNSIAGPTATGCYTAGVTADVLVGDTTPYFANLYSCSEIAPANYWFGLSRTQTGVTSASSTSWNVSMYIVPEMKVPFNQSYTAPAHFNENQHAQFMVTLPNDIQWTNSRVRFNVTLLSAGSLVFSVNQGRPAASTSDSCRGALRTSALVTSTTPQSLEFTSCSLVPGGVYYIGIEPRSITAGSLSYNISVTPFDDSVAPTNIFLDVPLGVSLSAGGNTVLRLPGITSFSSRDYFVLSVSVQTPANLPDILWNVHGDCSQFNSSFKDATRTTDPISAVTIFPCEMQANTDYFFTVNAPTLAGVTGFANLKKFTGAPYFINVNEAFSTSMNELEVAFLNLKLKPNDVLPGQNLIVTLANVSCGTVEAWINRGTTAGPTCNFKNSTLSCASAGCQILSLDACEMDDWSDDWWITVRATHQNVAEIPIKFTVSVAVVGSPSFRTIHTNEKHIVYATKVVSQTVQQQCNAQLGPGLAPCCDTVAPASPNVTLALENVHFVYPVEGAFMLDSDHSVTLSLTDFVGRATVYISPHVPKFCNQKPLPIPTEVSCTAAFNAPCTVRLSPSTRDSTNTTSCSWIDGVRQMYVWVDPSSIIWRRAISDTSSYPNGRVPVVNVVSNKDPYSITAVAFSPNVNYLQFSLAAKETQYIRVDHPAANDIANLKNYHFSASLSYSTGTVQLSGEWSACKAATTCTDTACTTLNPGVPQDKCSPQTLCKCAITYYRCQVTPGGSNRFAIYNPANVPVDASVRFSFTQPEEQLTPACEFVAGGSQRWYLPQLAPATRQIYKFDLQYFIDFESQVNAIGVTGKVDLIVDGGRPAFNNSPCSSVVRTSSSGLQSTILYRQASEPHLGVLGQIGIAKNHYKLTASLLDVNVTALENGKVYTTPTTLVDNTTQCSFTRTYQWFVFPSALAQRNGVLLVQLWGAGSTVYMNQDYVTYRWSPSATQTCTTNSAGYCFFVVGCGYTPTRDYYFHVDSSAFSFSVTFVPNPTSIMMTLNDTIYLNLVPGQFYSYNLNVPATTLPKRDLVISTSATTPGVVPTWVTTGSFSGLDCAIASILTQTRNPITISACDLNKAGSNFFVNFFLPSPTPVITPQCKNVSVVLSAYFTSDGIVATNAATTGATTLVGASGQKLRVRATPGTIGVGEVVYARIFDVTNGDAVIDSLQKGPHNSPFLTPALGKPVFPCPGCSSSAQFPHVAWQDECFFCTSVHDTVYVDTRPTIAAPAGNVVNYNLEVTKTTFTPLSSAWRSVTLADNKGITDHAGALAFFRATISQTQSQQIDLQVTSGSSVLVQIYGDCGTTPISYWCYQGSACQLPLPTNLNFGLAPETLSSSRLRIVVSGRSTTFRVRQSSGLGVCTAGPTSGFCAGTYDRADRLVWSLDENSTFAQKDSWASDRYQTLVSAFSCPVVDSCECAPLTKPCEDALRKLACSETFGTCSDQGFRLTLPDQLCATVTQACGKSFTAAGLPDFSCLHSFYYANPYKWVDGQGQTVMPPTETVLTITSAAASSAVSMTTSFTTASITTGGVSTASITTDSVTTGSVSTADSTSAGITTDSLTTTGTVSSTGTVTTSAQPTTAGPIGNTTNGITDGGASSGLSGGAIAGIIIGVILLLLIVAVVAWIFLRKVSTDGFNQFDDDKYTSILNEELKAEGSFDDSRL